MHTSLLNGLRTLETIGPRDATIAPARSQSTESAGESRSSNGINASKRHTVSLPSSPYQECATSRLGYDGTPRANSQITGSSSLASDVNLPRTSSTDDFEIPSTCTSSCADGRALYSDPDCDWATFISAYANGRWDPHKAPNRPRLCYDFLSERSSVVKVESVKLSTSLQLSAPQLDHAQDESQRKEKPAVALEVLQNQASSLIAASANGKSNKLKFDLPLILPGSAHRSRNSYPSSASNSSGSILISTGPSNPDIQTTVATMRWAAARVDISPLALPSPEHELTDPMRGVIAAVPGAHPADSSEVSDQIITPGGSRRSRLSSFWEGTTDVDSRDYKLPTIPRKRLRLNPSAPHADGRSAVASPVINQGPAQSSALSEPISQLSILAAQPPPATAPLLEKHAPSPSPDIPDYFGNHHSRVVHPLIVLPPPLSDVQSTASNPGPQGDKGLMTVPALPRRICLTRQSSSPLPYTISSSESRIPGGRVPSDSVHDTKAGRAVKEEQMYAELDYLVPPNPPDELDRRRALYKFNIWKTGPDMNFDRIAHLAKLVFNTKGVLVSLIDGTEQWFKSEWGLKSASCPRLHSICAHSILQQGDEPMIVLDTHLDWRFARNPLVTGLASVRFYAGAPLRTQDGYNIGTLALIDDVPREDFSPRQRHTLKEFAAIAMRELELWRDKIQLRIRDRIQSSMEEFTRECIEIDSEFQSPDKCDNTQVTIGPSMDRVYDRAAKLVQRTLDVEGVIVMDVTHCDVLETMGSEGNVSVTLHHGDPGSEMEKRQLSTEDYHSLNAFFAKYPEGKISEGILPPCFRPYMPTHIRYALLVPIFDIDKRPFALLCAYNTNLHSKRFLEGHELSYLRAIGVIILSAVLKRRMILADKAKSLFISNISHELRTPLHGILAAAELLRETPLSHSQMSFIQTVQACGTSLVETVNHVLDFTKLSGNSKAGGVENVIVSTSNNLMQLIEEAIDGSWIGYRARTAILGDSGIGSVYSPPTDEQPSSSPVPQPTQPHVETVIDIGYRKEGWLLKFEKGGIRRILMNLFGNSLKFTANGYVLVRLRLLPSSPGDPPNKVKVELAIDDTGKGISQNFLKNQLFHPFSQENPLQTGTGLGLAIVHSIAQSENVGGKVDVWSEEGVGTEIRVTFPAEVPEGDPRLAEAAQDMQSFKTDQNIPLPKVSMIGFDSQHKGIELLKQVTLSWITDWWGLEVVDGSSAPGDIVILNEDLGPILAAIEARDNTHPFIIFWTARGNPTVLSVMTDYERIGGFCRILYKPCGPSGLRVALKLCIHATKIGRYGELAPASAVRKHTYSEDRDGHGYVLRRNSDEGTNYTQRHVTRPRMTPRSATVHPSVSSLRHQLLLASVSDKVGLDSEEDEVEIPISESLSTVTIGSGGSILKSAIQSSTDVGGRNIRVLVVEDNNILRGLLIKWLIKKGYEFEEAVDGKAGVSVFEKNGPFDVALVDLSMPVLDGVAATAQMRRIEAARSDLPSRPHVTKILALTGMSSLEDKRKAFEAGVDGYLVKPVAFKTLEEMFIKLGISTSNPSPSNL